MDDVERLKLAGKEIDNLKKDIENMNKDIDNKKEEYETLKNCKIDICSLCMDEHKTHETQNYEEIKRDIKDTKNLMNELKKDMWSGECNQLDIYTTLLDLLGIESDWYGLGQSLFSPNYTNVISPRKWDISEWIIRSNYFSKKQ